MDNCKDQIEKYISKNKASLQSKQLMKKMRKNASCLSMENLNLDEENDDRLSDSMKSSDLEED